jgi:hypothetical protein
VLLEFAYVYKMVHWKATKNRLDMILAFIIKVITVQGTT